LILSSFFVNLSVELLNHLSLTVTPSATVGAMSCCYIAFFMKLTSIYYCLLFLCLGISLHGQDDGGRKLAINGFYESEELLTSGKEYHDKLFDDVAPYDPEGYLTRAIEKLQSGFVDEALVDAKEAIELYPEYGGAYYVQGLAFAEKDSFELAKRSYRKALYYAPLLTEASGGLATLLAHENKLDSARQVLETAIARTPAHSYLHYTLGIIELYDNHPSRAVQRIQDAIARDSCNVDAHVAVMIIQVERGKLKPALLQAEKAIPCDTDVAEFYVLKGLIQFFRGKHGQALRELDLAIEKNPDFRYARYLRSLVLISKSEYQAAVQELHKTFSLEATGRDSSMMTRFRENLSVALQYYEEERNLLSAKVNKGLEKGICNLFIGYSYSAIADFKQSLKVAANQCVSCHYFLGLSFERRAMRVEAEKEYTLALEIAPDLYGLYQRRGKVSSELGKWKMALADYSKLLKLDPENKGLHKERGHIHMNLLKYNIAILDYNIYLEHCDSADNEVLFNRAMCFKKINYYDNAIKDLTQVIDITGKDLEAYYERAFCHYMNKAFDKSSEDLDSVLLTNSFYPAAHNLQGVILMEAGKYDGALYHFTQALSQRKGYQEACFNKYLAYRGTDNFKGALHSMEELIEMDVSNGLYYFHRAYVKKQLGIDSACEDVEQALTLGLKVEPAAIEELCSN